MLKIKKKRVTGTSPSRSNGSDSCFAEGGAGEKGVKVGGELRDMPPSAPADLVREISESRGIFSGDCKRKGLELSLEY